jgi:hypothetical protein
MPKDAPSLKVLNTLAILMDKIKENGNSLSRTKMINHFGIKENTINDALEFGILHGCLEKGQYNIYSVLKDFSISENVFYPTIRSSVDELWRSEHFSSGEFFIEETARRESRIAGRWTRPDLTLISHKKFSWTIGYEFDVVTFEVKRPDSCNVLAVFEALSHASAATRAYVVFPIDAAAWRESDPEQESRVKDECSKHGVGLILVEDIFGNPKPNHIIKARRREIDHEKCSSFLGAVLSDAGRSRISQWK